MNLVNISDYCRVNNKIFFTILINDIDYSLLMSVILNIYTI